MTRRLDAEGWVAPYEKEYMRPDGTRAPVLISGVTLDRNPLRVVAVVIDLSERRAADRERELLLAREREARREAELSADRTSRLQRATAALSAASSAEDVGEVVVGQALEAFFAAAGALAFRDGDEVQIAHDRGFEDTLMAPWRRFHMRLDSPVCDVLRTGEPVYLETLDDWEQYAELRSGITGIFQAMVVVPLSFGGAVSGALVLCNTDARRFMAADRAFLASLADQAAHALERARLYEERAYVARTLQAGLLPERLADVPGLEVAVRYHSIADGGSVGGDFYDCFDISPDSLAGRRRRRRRQGHRRRRADRARAPHAARDRAARRAPGGHAAVPQRGAAPAVGGRRRSARSAAQRSTSARAAGSMCGWPPAAIPIRCSCAREATWRRSSCAARCSASRPTRCSSRRRSRSNRATRWCSTPTA